MESPSSIDGDTWSTMSPETQSAVLAALHSERAAAVGSDLSSESDEDSAPIASAAGFGTRALEAAAAIAADYDSDLGNTSSDWSNTWSDEEEDRLHL